MKRVNTAKTLVKQLCEDYGSEFLMKSTLGVLVDGLARANELDEAVAVLEEMHDLGHDVDERFVRILRIRYLQKYKSDISRIPTLIGPDPNAWKSGKVIKRALAKSSSNAKYRHQSRVMTSVERNR